MRRNRLRERSPATILLLAGVLHLGAPDSGRAQSELETAVEWGRTAWLRHDFEGLFASSDTVRLQLPEIGRHQGITPLHAARVLEEYVSSADEVSFELRRIREVSDDHAYAQLDRRYVVRGTEDQRIETVFLGFRQVGGRWRLREVRVTP